uniref:Capsid protein n=1 Tax=Porcine associated porprismacovirus TaxID=2496634 RepID=A0A482JV49_9VIRU|nr:capsid protein [Porcine associated porprismacovirus]
MATNFVKAKFQEIYDMGTVSGRTTILGIHTPQGVHVQNLLGGFFRQFRKFRYCGCSVTMVPAAQLPADPLQVSFEAGALTVDPRDLLNPILFHGCHGESLNEILNNYISNADITNTSSVIESRPTLAETEAGYYSALSDPSFRKFGIQSGAKVNLNPMVHPLVLTNPLVPSESKTTLKRTVQGQQGATAVLGELTGNIRDMDNNTDQVFYGGIQNPVPLAPLVNHEGLEFAYGVTPQMFSNGLRPLGWLPTTTFPPAPKVGENKIGTGSGSTYEVTEYTIGPTILPKLFMGFFMLPPSYTQEMYFRLIITHYFEFKEFTTCLGYNPNGPKYSYKETIPEPSPGTRAAPASLEVIDGNVELTTDGVY